MRSVLAVICAAACVATVAASAAGRGIDPQRRGGSAPAPSVRTETPKYACPAIAGTGAATKRRYCDVRIAEIVEDGIRVELPARTGAAIVQFDLHNRFVVAARAIAPSRQDVMAAIVSPDGKILDRAAVRAELRAAKDLFDRLVPASGRGTIAAAPGPPVRVRLSVPANLAFVSIVGMKQTVQLPSRLEHIEKPGQAIALASNFEISYTPRSR